MVTDSTNQADDTTAFLRAARSGNLEKVIEYLDTDLDINTANSNGLNALHLASKDGHVEIVTELLKRGAKVDAATKKGNTALHIASLAGQAEIVSILIQYGAAVNIQSQNGFTPLYMAAQENHDQVVKLLLSNGANQSLATEDGFTPLAVAMQQGHDKVVSVLLENDSKGKVRLPALHIAAKKDDCKAADLLLQNDHKPDVTSKSGFTPLHIAAHYGNEEIARLLIKRGADVNYLAKHNISPLHVAAKWGKNNMVKILLENSAQIDAKTRDGLTPLHCAARSGHEEVVNTLLENSAPISARTKNGLAPLHMASQGDHVDAARALLYHRAPVDEVTIDYLTSLHVAAHCGHVRVAKLLLDRKADPNARALNGFTPLHIACKKNRIKVVELLLKHGASIESTTESGLTPLHVASFMGCMNIVIFLLQHEANPDVPTVRGETPLHLAARANQTDIIRILLRNGAKVDARAREQQTPLHIASRLGNIDIVMLLLQHGAAVDTTTKDMHTALHIAAKEGQEEVAAILVENNASVKATTKNGFTPLHIAAKYGNMNVAKILLQKDSKLDAQGKNDITPLHLACHYDHPNVANLLLEKGASPHLASQNGHTPLHIAARKNQMDIASTLLEGGANANAESKAGFTPLHLSSQKGHYDMTNLLIEHGADPNHKAKNGLTALHLCAQEDFVRVASILVKNDANVESQTETGYRPIHVAAHFGNLSMIRFLLKHNAEIDVRTAQNYTPLHQAAQQGHAHVVSALLEGNASHKARTNDGLTALNIAQKLGYISVMEVLKGMPYDNLVPDNKNWEEKYKVIAPESLQETSLMSDSDDEGASDALISEQPYKYLTADLMKSLRDDSLPIDVTKDDPIHRQVTKEEKQEFTQSNNYCLAENFDSNDALNLGRLHFRSFLVSFLVDARGGAMKGCRHSGVRIIVPPRRATMPLRVTCRLVKPSKVANPPPLMEGEALATRIIEMGPVGANFLGPVLIDIPHFASIRGKEREIIILRSENGETWKEHDNSVDNDDTLLNTPHDPQMNAAHSGRITRIITSDFPQYFAIVTRIKQEVHVIGAEGGILMSSVANDVQAVFPPGALTKKIKVGLQAHVIPAELTAKLLGNCVAVSPVITIEPRRRKFHKPITLTIPVPQAANKGMINQYGGETPTLRLLCSIAGGTSEAQWEDVTGSTPLTFMNDRVSFTTTVSARFWLMDCRNISEVPKMATELYKESLFVPYITNFVIYSKRMDTLEATLRILCMTDGKEGMHTLERQEEFLEIVKSRDVEALHGKDLYIEFSGNLIPVTKSGVQLKFTFKAFRQNRLSFHVKVRDPLLDPVARMLFMREPKVAKGEPPQQPICVLNIVLPEVTSKIEIQKKLTAVYEDSNIISQKMDSYKSKYGMEQKEKGDQPKDTSPSEEKFIADTLQKEQTDAATIHESFAQKAACPLESVDASYPNKVAGQQEHDLSPSVEKQTYSEKRKFWEDISKKRESYQRSESEVSRTSQLTVNESDSEYMQNVVSEEEITEVTSVGSDTMENVNIPDISECSVAEKAHYFEEQIQKELSKVPAKLQQQDSVKLEKDKSVKVKRTEKSIDVGQVETMRDVEHEGKELKSSHVEEKDKDESDKLRKEDFKGEEIIYKERIDEFVRKEYQEKLVVGLEKKVELHREVRDIEDKKEDERKESELKKKKEEEEIKKKAAELQKKLEEEEAKRKETEVKKKQEEEEAKRKEAELKKKQEEEEARRKEAELKKKKEEEEAKKKEAELKKKQEEEEAKRKEAELKKKKEEEEAKKKEAELKKKQEEEEAKRKEAELKKKKEEEEAKKKEAELKKKQEEEEAKRKEAELKKKKEEEEAKKKEAELKKKQEEEEEARRKEAELKKKKEEEEAKRKQAELKKKKEEEEAKKKKEEEEAKKKKEEEEAKRKKEEEEAKKKKEEEEAKKKEEEAKRKKEEEEAKKKEEEAKKKKEEEEAKKKKEEEEAKKKKEEEEAKKKKEEEEAKKKEEEEAKRKEAELKKKKEEEEAKKKEEEAKKKKEEEEAKKKKEEEEAKKMKEEEAKKKKEEEEAKKKEEEEAKKKKEEEEANRKEAELKKKKEEEEIKRKEIELKKKQEEEEAKRKKEEEEAKRRKEEEEAKKKKLEEEAKRIKEEEETKRKEAELKKKQEEEEAKRRKEEEEEAKKKKQEEEVKKKREEEETKRKEVELMKKQEEEEAKRRKEEEAKMKKEEEEAKKKEAELKKKEEEEKVKKKETELKKKQEEEEAKKKETDLKKKQEEEAKKSESKRKEEMELQKEAYEELEKHVEKATLVQILPEQLERSIEEAREIHQKELPEHIDRIVEKHELELQKEYLMERGESSTESPKHSMEIAGKESELMQIHSKQTEHKEDISMQDKGLGKDMSTGRRVIKEETTIIWKVQEDGSLVQEKVTKTVQIEGDEDVPVTTEIMNVPETSLEPKVLYEAHYTAADLEEKLKEDTKIEISKKDQVTAFIPEVQKEKTEDLEKEKLEEDKIPLQKSTIESDSKLTKKEFESRIPISMAKVEKDRNHKESRSKTSTESKRLLEKSEIDKSSAPQEEPSITSPVDKKKEFESRIPKRIIDTSATKSSEKDIKKGYHVKTETETCTVTEKKSSSQETTSKSETQTFSKTFTDPHKAFKLLEDMSEKDTIKLSKVDHKASSKLEKKEVVSSEISKGTDKYIVHEEKEQIECKKLSESKMKKESSTETVEKEESKSKKVDETAVQKMSINLQDGQETIDASASKNRVEAKKEQLSKKLEDKEGIMTEESGVSRLKESDIDIAVRIHKEDVEKKKVEDTGEPPVTSKIFEDLGKVEMVTKGESHKETVESFDARHFIPSSKVEEKLVSVKKDGKPEEKAQVLSHETLEEKQRRAAKEIEARQIVECLIESIENEITKRSSITEDPKAAIVDSNYLQQVIKESVETDHEKLADDLTKKFESIMKRTMDEELVESTKDTDSTAESAKLRSSIHEEEKRSTRDSMSISEDITKDEESSLHDKDESFLLSSSQARLPERDITMSPSSISDQIELEETMDVDTNELEDITKPTSSPQSEKLRSDRSSAQAESLQRESYEPQYDISLPKDRIYDVSGARVLEIVEPGIDSQSRQDSVDVPSLEMDEYKISEDTGKTISSLHESAAVDSLERIAQERDMTFSPSTVSEDINVDYSLVHEQIPTTTTEKYEVSVKRADSFEIESPPLVSPRLKIRHDLEIKPVNWMIGDEKIEISETLQPSQVFNQELEEYETTIKKQRLSSQSESADLEQESATKSSEDPSVIESIKESITTGDTTVTTVIKTKKFTVIPVSDQDIESELIENKLEVSCQELVDTLKREYEAKTPTEDLTVSIRRPLSLEEAKIKLSEMKLVESSKIETTTDQLEISSEKESIDTAKEITSVSEEKSETKEEVTEQIGKDEEMGGEPLTEKYEDDTVKDTTMTKNGLSLEKIAEPSKEDVKLLEDTQTQDIAAGGTLEDDVDKAVHVDDLAKEWTEPSLTKIKISSDDYKRHVEKGFEKREKAARASTVTSSDTCAFKLKKDDLPGVDLSSRYAITVLDQVVKKEIAEVKESLEAARQDLIEELSENSETVIQIKDSPSEFQFKLQPESIPNDLPFLYRPPSLEQIAVDIEGMKTESLITSEEKPDESKRDEKEIPATESGSEEIELEASGDEMDKEKVCMDIEMELDKSETETLSAVHEESKEDDDTRPSPVPASRSCSDVEYKDESSSSLHPPQPVPRRRHKPARASKKVTSESEVDPGSSSGESSNYQSCDYEIGSGSRPSSSDVEALQSATMPPSGTTSEYETAMMSVEHSTTSRPTSQEYQTAVSTLSSRESMKSLSSFSSGHLGSIDSTSELSETLVASEADADKGEEHEDLERAFDEEHAESDSSGSDIPMDDAMDKIDSNIPCRMKRSSEMIFQQIMDDNAALDTDLDEPILEQDTKGVDFATSAFVVTPGAVQSVDIMTARVTEDGVQSVSTQVISTQVTTSTTEIPAEETTLKTTVGTEIDDKPSDESLEMLSMEPDSLEPKSGISVTADESTETVMQTSARSIIQQASMSTSSTSGLSLDTVIEKAKSERSESPGSDSFELVDKPDIIDDFVVIEEVGREAEEFDSEGKSIRITAIPQVSSKQYDRDLENLITENKEDSQVSTSQTSRNNELFDFESEESPPQASNDDQYSQSYSDEEPYETGKKWIEMQFHADARVYDIEYDRGPLEDIKEEEITDFEAGSSRFGSLGSHKESIGSVGSMRGSFGSTPDYDVLAGKKYFTKPSDHDTVSLSSLQEFEHLESAVAAENSKRLQCGSQDSINNGSLPRRYMTGRSGHGDDISLSSLKDFEGLERACREAHLIELRAREEEDLLEHESPENRYKMESLQRKSEISATGSINPSTSGSDDYEKRIKEIDEIIRIAQSNVERLDRQDDTTEDISQIEITDIEKTGSEAIVPVVTEAEDIQRAKDTNIMETSTDSLELEDNADKKHPLCQSSDSLEMKTTLDFPSLSSDSLNNVRDTRDAQLDVAEQFSNGRRMSSDSLDVPIIEQPDNEIQEESNNRSERPAVDNSVGQSSSTETNIAKQDTTKLPPSSKT
uniref:ankyrin-2-like isoform X3 n=1 Tax=Vespula vulgaris TaxID=7454 RepID=UPI00223B8E62|nr:ankyrin-2-like isoform X3 [Vespula vulgaris]